MHIIMEVNKNKPKQKQIKESKNQRLKNSRTSVMVNVCATLSQIKKFLHDKFDLYSHIT